MTTKDALFREIKYALAGEGGALEGLLEQSHIKMDVRIQPSSSQSESDYPWLIFRRVTWEENKVRYSRERFEIELIGLQSSPTKGDDLLELIKNALIDHFAGRVKTWGKFAEDGTVDTDGGLRMKAVFIDTVDMSEHETKEKVQILMFAFTHVRA